MRKQTDGPRVRGTRVRHNGGQGGGLSEEGHLSGDGDEDGRGARPPWGDLGRAPRAPGAVKCSGSEAAAFWNSTEAGVRRAKQAGAGWQAVCLQREAGPHSSGPFYVLS